MLLEVIGEPMGDHSIPKGLHGGGASKWDMKEALLRQAEVAGTLNAKGRAVVHG